MKKRMLGLAIAAAAVSGIGAAMDAHNGEDFGLRVQNLLHANSEPLFGIKRPLVASANAHTPRHPGQEAGELVELARGLEARILTRGAGNKADMFSLWPKNEPTHALFCIEGGNEVVGKLDSGHEKLNPSVQSVNLASGEVITRLRGMNRCDGIRTTDWGTVLATEETSDGGAYELIDPLAMHNHTVTDRNAGVVIDADGKPSVHVAKRAALPTMSWEGLTVLESGVVIGGDELRPGDSGIDRDGGAIYKFIPRVPASGTIRDLADSPLVAGTTYALQVQCKAGGDRGYGQGCEVGGGEWIAVSAVNARLDAHNSGATGYYRPEDLHRDPTYRGEGVRFCWTNTGREGNRHYGEVMCGVDPAPLAPAAFDGKQVVVNRFVEGDADFNSVDNLAFQPGSGNVYVIEDHRNGDVFACLPDGADRDLKSDGCIKVLSVKDQSAEPTGFGFLANGRTALMSIQHSDDSRMPLIDDYRTDDILVITGFRHTD